MTTATWRYARAVAFAALEKVKEAEAEKLAFYQAFKNVPSTRFLFNNSCSDILRIAEQMMLGEIEYRKQNFDAAFDHLRRAIDLDDNLKYDEPWAWMQPVRHALGALLLEQGRVEDALDAYRADLGMDETLVHTSRHPNNIWSLQGVVECLERLGRGEEAEQMKPALERARANADDNIRVSCFCRLTHHQSCH